MNLNGYPIDKCMQCTAIVKTDYVNISDAVISISTQPMLSTTCCMKFSDSFRSHLSINEDVDEARAIEARGITICRYYRWRTITEMIPVTNE